jgi:hypothetical protein
MTAPTGSSHSVVADPHTPQWNPSNNHYYQVIESWASDSRWFGMNFLAGGMRFGRCTAGHLATIQDAVEGDFLATLATDGRRYFVGGFRSHAAGGTITDGWGWVAGGGGFVYAPWLPGQPAGSTAPDYGTYLQGGTALIAAIDANAGGLPALVEYEGCPAPQPPSVSLFGPTTVAEGTALTLNASVSDPDGDAIVSFGWDLDGDGTFETNSLSAPVLYTDDGVHTLSFRATDSRGSVTTKTTTITVTNEAPALTSIGDATIIAGETFNASGSFTDAGTDTWTATVDYGTGAQPLALSGNSFSLSHAYASAGTFTVTVTVADDDGGTGTTTATVVVQSAAQAATELSSTIDALVASGAIDAGTANSLTQSLGAAANSLANGNTNAAKNQLDAFANKVRAQSGKKLTVDQANALLSMAARIKANIG